MRFGTKLCRLVIGTNCAPFVADIILFCYERETRRETG